MDDSFDGRLDSLERSIRKLSYLMGGKASAGRARWRSQRRDPNTGKWIDETVGPGFGGKRRKVNPNFGAHTVDAHRKRTNESITLSGKEKHEINKLLSEGEAAFLAGDNDKGEALVRDAMVVKRQSDDRAELARREVEANRAREGRGKKPGTATGNRVTDGVAAKKLEERIQNAGSPKEKLDLIDDLIATGDDRWQDDIDFLMSDLHVDDEQGDLSPKQEAKFRALEDKFSPESQTNAEDMASPQEQNAVIKKMEKVERLMSADVIDWDELDDTMADLHVDMEQAEFPDVLMGSYLALEERWLNSSRSKAYVNSNWRNQVRDTAGRFSRLGGGLPSSIPGGGAGDAVRRGPPGKKPKTGAGEFEGLSDQAMERIEPMGGESRKRWWAEMEKRGLRGYTPLSRAADVEARELDRRIAAGETENPIGTSRNKPTLDPQEEARRLAREAAGIDEYDIQRAKETAGALENAFRGRINAIKKGNPDAYINVWNPVDGVYVEVGTEGDHWSTPDELEDMIDGPDTFAIGGPLDTPQNNSTEPSNVGARSRMAQAESVENYDADPESTFRELQAEANEQGVPIMNPFTGEWVQPEGSGGAPTSLHDDPDNGAALQEISEFAEMAKEFDDLGDAVQQQMEEYINNPGSEDLNPNAVDMIERFLDRFGDNAPHDFSSGKLREYSDLGWSIQEQMHAILAGESFHEQNPNALEIISRFLRSGMGNAGNNLAIDIDKYLLTQRKSFEHLKKTAATPEQYELLFSEFSITSDLSYLDEDPRLEKAMEPSFSDARIDNFEHQLDDLEGFLEGKSWIDQPRASTGQWTAEDEPVDQKKPVKPKPRPKKKPMRKRAPKETSAKLNAANVTQSRAEVKRDGLYWGGATFKDKKSFSDWLEKRGASWAEFERKHPEAAKGLEEHEERKSKERESTKRPKNKPVVLADRGNRPKKPGRAQSLRRGIREEGNS